jgi:arylsulfatase A-like enzyme
VESAKATTDRVLKILRRYKDRLESSPFYLEVLYIDPHAPYKPPKKHLKAVEPSSSPKYDGEIRYADAEFGRLIKRMKKEGFLDNTIIVFTSDHGEGLDSHPSVTWGKTHGRLLYESNLHVPLIVSHSSLPKGKVIKELTSGIDLMPTILDAIGLGSAIPKDLHGRSLMPLVQGKPKAQGREYVFAETEFRKTYKTGIRSSQYKYIRNDDAAQFRHHGRFEGKELEEKWRKHFDDLPDEEFYQGGNDRWKEDPPLSQFASEDEKTSKCREELVRWEKETLRRPPEGRADDDVITMGDGTVKPSIENLTAPTKMTPEIMEQLKSLGYMNNE